MKRALLLLVALSAVVIVGCSSGPAKAVTPDTQYDFGNVPVTNDMNQAKTKTFAIKNDGTGDLKLSDVQVKLLQGC